MVGTGGGVVHSASVSYPVELAVNLITGRDRWDRRWWIVSLTKRRWEVRWQLGRLTWGCY